MKLLLEDLNVKVDREDICEPTIGKEIFHEIGNYNGVRTVNFATSKNLAKVHCSHIETFINLLGHLITHNQICHILIDRR
jgi:hypothetical protein